MQVGLRWCREPDRHCDPAFRRHHTLSPADWRSTQNTVFVHREGLADQPEGEPMEVIYPRAAGLDIHLKLIVACRITPGEGSRVQREVRSFGTTTAAIGQMAD